MDKRKRPRPSRVDPDLVSSQQPRCAGPVTRSQVGEPSCIRQAAALSPRMSTRISVHSPRHPFNCYDADTWSEVVKHLCGRDLLRLSGTSRWFRRFLADDTLWRYAIFRDFNLTAANPRTAQPPHGSWRHLYLAAFNGSHAYCFRDSDKHIVAWRLGGFLLDSSDLLLSAKLPLPMWPPLLSKGVKNDIEAMGVCVVTNARPGVWIVDFHRVRCSCKIKTCRGVMQVLDARHSGIFLEKAYRRGVLDYEDLGTHLLGEKASFLFCAIFSLQELTSSSTARVLNTNAWTSIKSETGALDVKTIVTTYAIAIGDCNLDNKNGCQSSFQAMRDTASDGKIVSVRISQLLI